MKNILSIAALSGMLCVVLGAFGAHGLKPLLSADMLAVYETGVRYQFYHTLALVLVALLYFQHPAKDLLRAAYLFIAGMVLFSGSLYALALVSTVSDGFHWLGAITPLGGTAFIAGWIFLFVASRKLILTHK